jgi:hypothetical protein
MSESPQIAFLHRIVGVGRVAQEIAGKRVNVVEMRQGRISKAPRFVCIQAVDA